MTAAVLMWRQPERLGELAWRGPDRTVMLMAARGQTGAIAAVFGAPYPLTAEAIDDAGGDPTARAAAAAAQTTANSKADATAAATALAKRTESYVQSSEPATTAPAMWFDTSDPNFLTLKIQRG